ncbi:hypothetical protein DID96_12925 [Burkholderia sp. Bp8963]|nr:hypothetical protein DID96_12925 [Burkholderia sp. Bp8963]
MLDCRSRRTAFAAPLRPPSRDQSNAGSTGVRATFAAIAMLTLGLVGWYRIERLLASIPDSNDDFGIV